MSNFNEKQIERILDVCKIRPVNLQVEIHAYFSNRTLVNYCHARDISVCAYAPLGSSSPTRWFGTKDNHLKDPVVMEISNKYQKTPAQILLRHLVQRGLIVIPKSGNPARINENFNIWDFELIQEDFQKIENLDKNKRLFDGFLPEFPVRKLHPEHPF